MNKHALAEALRQRQIKKGYIPLEIIKNLTDDSIIDSYITCSHCKEKQVSPEELKISILMAQNVDDWFDICDHYGGSHCSLN